MDKKQERLARQWAERVKTRDVSSREEQAAADYAEKHPSKFSKESPN